MKTKTINDLNFKSFRGKVHFYYSNKGTILRRNLGINDTETTTTKNKLLIENIRNQFNEIIFNYKIENGNNNPPAEMVKQLLFQKTITNDILDHFDLYIETLLNQREIKTQSITPYKSLRIYLQIFLEENKLTTIDQSFLDMFISFLTDEKHKLQRETLRKRIIYFKTFINYLLRNNLIKQFTPYYGKRKFKLENIKHIESLTKQELNFLIKQRKLENETKYKQVLDMFIFQCLTSLRYGDLIQVKKENIKKDLLSFTTEKTYTPIYINLNNILTEILEENDYNLNHFSNHYYNTLLKQLFIKYSKDNKKEMPELNKQITIKTQLSNTIIETKKKRFELFTSHTGRRTFITIQIHLGTSLPEIMKLTGHKKINILNEYLDIYNTIKRGEKLNIINDMVEYINN